MEEKQSMQDAMKQVRRAAALDYAQKQRELQEVIPGAIYPNAPPALTPADLASEPPARPRK